MDEPTTFLGEWERFERDVIEPSDAPMATALKVAFYAGAMGFWRQISEARKDEDVDTKNTALMRELTLAAFNIGMIGYDDLPTWAKASIPRTEQK